MRCGRRGFGLDPRSCHAVHSWSLVWSRGLRATGPAVPFGDRGSIKRIGFRNRPIHVSIVHASIFGDDPFRNRSCPGEARLGRGWRSTAFASGAIAKISVDFRLIFSKERQRCI